MLRANLLARKSDADLRVTREVDAWAVAVSLPARAQAQESGAKDLTYQ